MDVISSGVDTIKLKFILEEPLPVNDRGFESTMRSIGWDNQSQAFASSEPDATPRSSGYKFQSENTTLRYRLIDSGRYITAEYSIPRYVHNSVLNFNLASQKEALESINQVAQEITSNIPRNLVMKLERIPRIDVAIDVNAYENKLGLIAAATHFKFPKVRKPLLKIFPNETVEISSPRPTKHSKKPTKFFKVYDKANEALSKNKLKDLPIKESLLVKEAKEKGRIRLEYSFMPRGGNSSTFLENDYLSTFGEKLKEGFGCEVITVGKLPKLQKFIDSLDIHESSKTPLYAYIVRYMTIGEKGIKENLDNSTFKNAKKGFRKYGINPNNFSDFEGEIDLKPIFEHLSNPS